MKSLYTRRKAFALVIPAQAGNPAAEIVNNVPDSFAYKVNGSVLSQK